MRHAPRFGILLSVAALAIGVAACGSDSDSESSSSGSSSGANTATPREGVTKDTIKYGMIYDQTGPQTVAQTPWAHGFLTQINKANKAGGVNGRTIKLLVEDEKYEVPTGLAAYKKLVSQTPALGIIGLNNSSLQVAAIKQVETNKVPVFGAEATTKQAINPFNDYFFAMQCSYADQADVAVPYMAEKTGASAPKVATIAARRRIGLRVVGDLIKARVEKAGGQYLGHTALTPTATEADAQVQKIVAKQNPDFIALHGSPNTLDDRAEVDAEVRRQGPDDRRSSPPAAPSRTARSRSRFGIQFESVNCYTPSDDRRRGDGEMLARAKEFGFEKSAASTDFVNGYVVGQVAHRGAQGGRREPEPRVVQEGPRVAERSLDRRALRERHLRRQGPRRHPDGAPVLLRLRHQDVQGGRRVHRLRRRHLQRVPRGHRVGLQAARPL